MIDLAEIKIRLEKATPGEWTQSQECVKVNGHTLFFTYMANRNDAEFVSHAPADIRDLLAEVERLKGDIKNLQFLLTESSMKIAEYEHTPLMQVRRWQNDLCKYVELGKFAMQTEGTICGKRNIDKFGKYCKHNCANYKFCRSRAEIEGKKK